MKNTLKPRRVFETERTDAFIVEGNKALWELADSCARLWSELNFKRR